MWVHWELEWSRRHQQHLCYRHEGMDNPQRVSIVNFSKYQGGSSAINLHFGSRRLCFSKIWITCAALDFENNSTDQSMLSMTNISLQLPVDLYNNSRSNGKKNRTFQYFFQFSLSRKPFYFFSWISHCWGSQSSFFTASISCETTEIVVDLMFDEPFLGRVALENDPKTRGCSFLGNGSTEYQFKIPIRGCGTKREEYLYSNTMMIIYGQRNVLAEGDQKKIILCQYPVGVLWRIETSRKTIIKWECSGLYITDTGGSCLHRGSPRTEVDVRQIFVWWSGNKLDQTVFPSCASTQRITPTTCATLRNTRSRQARFSKWRKPLANNAENMRHLGNWSERSSVELPAHLATSKNNWPLFGNFRDHQKSGSRKLFRSMEFCLVLL